MKLSYRSLLIFSIPSILATVLEPLASIVDTAFIGNINSEWLGALALATTILNLFTWMFNFLVHGPTQSVSQAVGDNNYKLAGKRILIALYSSIIIGILSATFLYFAKDLLYNLVASPQNLLGLVDEYFIIRLTGHAFTLIFTTQLAVLRGLGLVRVCFYLICGTTITNIILNYLFLYIFNFSIGGAAWGTVLSHIIGVTFSFIYIQRKFSKQLQFNYFNIKRSDVLFFGRNSLNIFFRSFTLAGTFFMATRIAAKLDGHYLAAHQIILQIWLFVSYFTDGIAVTGNIMMARYITNNNIQKMRILSRKLLHLGLIVGFTFSLIIYFGDYFWMSLFTSDAIISSELLKMLPLLTIIQIPNCLTFVYDGLLFGTGDFSYIRKHIMIGGVVFFLPLAYFSLELGNLYGIWLGFSVFNLYRLSSSYFKVNGIIKGIR
jgi:MATE family multidrug resistance protein